ncbi:MAG: elongation factor 4 [Acidimicrobiia bacterium]|nr:elongation factor 4 [Acidimicrobiia bacterium]MYC46123.1 elongation factor 4 [Acidimicrobiia bacterium]MYI19753.1 elongation factor 4 [Acidimicrobiia bacterium]
MDQSRIRNVAIIAHIDHGKSTLADRFLEICEAVEPRAMRAQYLDSMDLERERGITIKLQSVRLSYGPWWINLIDTPGHVDFGYEVSRSLAACEGVILLVDAAQGIEAQTLANCSMALEHDLTIVAALNKVDLPAADPDRVAGEIEQVIGIPAGDVLRISAKTGEGVRDLLDAVTTQVPPPAGDPEAELQALIFDSHFDQYRGVVSSLRVVQGMLHGGSQVRFMQAEATHETQEIGVRTPAPTPVDALGPGEVGYLIAGVKNTAEARAGETVTGADRPAPDPLVGYREPKAMVFCGLYPIDGDEYLDLRDALDRLRLNDSSFSYTPETSTALGFGYRCGFLGLLHMEIITERLEREFDLDIIATTPSVEYRVRTTAGTEVAVDSPSRLPPAGEVAAIAEPFLLLSIIAPARHTGTLMELCQKRRGTLRGMDYLSPERVELRYRLPLAEVVTDFYDLLKSRTQGYASLDYDADGYEDSDLVRVDILLQHEPVDAFSSIVHRDEAYSYGRRMTAKLRELIPRQQFDVPIQAAIGSRIIARETVKAFRKDVTAGLYGGDVTRKRKVLERQKAGKRRMKAIGRVEVPPEAFVSALRMPTD